MSAGMRADKRLIECDDRLGSSGEGRNLPSSSCDWGIRLGSSSEAVGTQGRSSVGMAQQSARRDRKNQGFQPCLRAGSGRDGFHPRPPKRVRSREAASRGRTDGSIRQKPLAFQEASTDGKRSYQRPLTDGSYADFADLHIYFCKPALRRRLTALGSWRSFARSDADMSRWSFAFGSAPALRRASTISRPSGSSR